MSLDLVISIGIIAAVVYYVGWHDYIKPMLPTEWFTRQEPVKRLPVPRSVRQRSQRSLQSNTFKQRSAQQNGENDSVQRSPERSGLAAGDHQLEQLHITQKELTQVARAYTNLARGNTEQESIELAFQCTKGGGKSWKRAKALFDLARELPDSSR